MTKKSALIIVDMQYTFNAANDKVLICNIISEIEKSKKNKDIIFVLEYNLGGCKSRTILDIRKSLENYENVFWVRKDEDDGSMHLIKCIIKNSLSINSYKVCGVNASACVHETILGLCRFVGKLPILILDKCCSDEFYGLGASSIKSLEKIKCNRIKIKK